MPDLFPTSRIAPVQSHRDTYLGSDRVASSCTEKDYRTKYKLRYKLIYLTSNLIEHLWPSSHLVVLWIPHNITDLVPQLNRPLNNTQGDVEVTGYLFRLLIQTIELVHDPLLQILRIMTPRLGSILKSEWIERRGHSCAQRRTRSVESSRWHVLSRHNRNLYLVLCSCQCINASTVSCLLRRISWLICK